MSVSAGVPGRGFKLWAVLVKRAAIPTWSGNQAMMAQAYNPVTGEMLVSGIEYRGAPPRWVEDHLLDWVKDRVGSDAVLVMLSPPPPA